MKMSEHETITVPPDGRPLEQQPKWRQDFPIDVPRDEYISRREFTKFMVLISFAFVIGQFWIFLKNVFRKTMGKLPIREITKVSEINVGDAKIFDYPEKHNPCILVRSDAQTFLAYSQKCTHLSCPVIPVVSESQFHCPCHEGYFDLSTGTPIAGPPRRPLPRIQIEVRGERIYAVGMEQPA